MAAGEEYSAQDNATVTFRLGQTSARLSGLEDRMTRHEDFVRENMHGINVKLDDIKKDIAMNAGGRQSWQTMITVALGLFGAFGALVSWLILRAFGTHM